MTAAGCGGDDPEPQGMPSGTLRVYASLPTNGPEGARGRSALEGARLALRRAGSRAGGRRIELVALTSNGPGDLDWDPATVEDNARRAAKDPRAIAYLGELDGGGSTVSLPITNAEDILQVAPADGLTSLTKQLPLRPGTAPARLTPSGRRSFVTLVPPDDRVARAMLEAAGAQRGRRLALVDAPGVAERELGSVLGDALRRRLIDPVVTQELRSGASDPTGAVDAIVAKRPQAVLVAGSGEPVVGRLLRGLATRLPSAPVIASPALARTVPDRDGPPGAALTQLLPAGALSERARRRLAALGPGTSSEALYGYDAMRLVLRAINRGGPRRPAVVRAGRRPRAVRGWSGTFTVDSSGAARRYELARVRLVDGRARILRTSP